MAYVFGLTFWPTLYRAKVAGDKSSRERKLPGSFALGSETSTVWSFRSQERKCMGSKRPYNPYIQSTDRNDSESFL